MSCGGGQHWQDWRTTCGGCLPCWVLGEFPKIGTSQMGLAPLPTDGRPDCLGLLMEKEGEPRGCLARGTL